MIFQTLKGLADDVRAAITEDLAQMKEENQSLKKMFDQQEKFISLLVEKRDHPRFPVDMGTKEGQRFVRSLAHECVAELFEATNELKNSKRHRATEINEFNRDAFLEELTDAMHYLVGIAICSGVSAQEFYDMYVKKGKTNIERINSGY